MPTWNGTIYTSATLTGNGNSGWLDMEAVIGRPEVSRDYLAVESALLRFVPAGLATDETLDLDLDLAWKLDGTGSFKAHDFTQVTSSNAAETLVLPGGDSVGSLWVELGTNAGVLAGPIPPYWKLTWTLGGSTKSMSFALYGCLRY